MQVYSEIKGWRMKRPNESVLKSIVSLRGNEFFDEIIKWFEESKEAAVVTGIFDIGATADISKGKAQELSDIVNTLDGAAKMLNNFKT